MGAARQHLRRDGDSFKNFENDGMRRQGMDQVAEQQAVIDFDETLVRAECVSH